MFALSIKDSACCTIVSNPKEADLRIKLNYKTYVSEAALVAAAVNGASFGVIPTWATGQYTVFADVQNKKGIEKKYQAKDSTTIVLWLPLLFAYPFAKPDDVESATLINMNRYILQQVHNDGWI